MGWARFYLSSFFFILLSLITFLSAQVSFGQLFPDGSVSKLTRYISEVHPYIVEPYEGNICHEPESIRNLIGQQKRLLEEMRKLESFEKDWKGRQLITITVDRVRTESRKERTLSSEKFEGLKSELLAEWGQLAKGTKAPSESRLHAELELLSSRSANRVNGIVVGLANLLPKTKKAAVFKAGIRAEQVALLEAQSVEDAEVRSRFKGAAYGLSQETLTYSEVLGVLKEAIKSQERLVRLMVLRDLILGVRAETGSELSRRGLENLTLEDFQRWVSPEEFRALPGELAEKVDRNARKEMAKAFSDAYLEQKSVRNQTTEPYVKVREVPPFLAAFRGGIGGDCSTGASWGVPYSPFQRVFYVFNSKNEVQGYLSVTIGKVDGKKVAYLKDLTGPHLSAEMAERVLHAVHSAVRAFGVTKLYLAHQNWTNGQNHYEPLVEMFRKYNEGEGKAFESIDAEYLEVFRRIHGSNSYDSPDSHERAIPFKAKRSVKSKIAVSHSQAEFMMNARESSPEEILKAVRKVLKNPKAKIAEGVSKGEVKRLVKLFENPRSKKIESYYKSIAKELGFHGITVDQNFIDANWDLYAPGHLRCRDAFKGRDANLRRQTARAFLFVLGSPAYESLKDLIRQNRDWLKRNTIVVAGIQQLKARQEEQGVRERLRLVSSEGLTGIRPLSSGKAHGVSQGRIKAGRCRMLFSVGF